MKKLFMLYLLGAFCLVGEARAQLQKGSRYWGATVNFNGDHTNYKYAPNFSYDNNRFSVTPSIQTGWFFRDNTMFGMRLTSSMNWLKNNNENPGIKYYSGINYGSVSLSPFIRNYKSLSPKWAIFLHSGVNASYMWSKSYSDQTDEKDNGYGAQIYVNPGIVFWITPRFALESDLNVLSLALGYSHFNGNSINFNAGVTSSISQYFGLRASWYLQSK